MSWKVKSLLGILLQLLLQSFPLLLNFFVRTSKSKYMKAVQKWSLIDGTLELSFPEYESRIALDKDSYLVAIRGSLPLFDWLSAISRFISVYRKMLS